MRMRGKGRTASSFAFEGNECRKTPSVQKLTRNCTRQARTDTYSKESLPSKEKQKAAKAKATKKLVHIVKRRVGRSNKSKHETENKERIECLSFRDSE